MTEENVNELEEWFRTTFPTYNVKRDKGSVIDYIDIDKNGRQWAIQCYRETNGYGFCTLDDEHYLTHQCDEYFNELDKLKQYLKSVL